MKSFIQILTVLLLSVIFISCASEKKKKIYHHSEANYKRIDRFPSSGEHAPLMRNVLDQNLYDACRRERSERYCKRRLGTWRQ